MPVTSHSIDGTGPLSKGRTEVLREMAGDIETLFALFTEVQKKATEAKGSASHAIVFGPVLTFVITSATSIDTSPNRWRYEATVGETDPTTGLTTAVAGGMTATLYNIAEDDSAYQHGQDMAPNGVTLTTSAVEGPVNARATGLLYSGSPVYLFDTLNPTDPACPP